MLKYGGRALGLTLLVAGAWASTQMPVATQGRPNYRVDPWWPRPFTNQSWVLGSITGVTVDAQNHVWVVHRGGDSLEANEKGMMLTPPSAGPLLSVRAARCSSSTRRACSCRAGAVQARATPGRSRPAASPSTPRATCGSPAPDSKPRPSRRLAGAATPWSARRRRRARRRRAGTRRSGGASRRARAEVLARRQVPAADRHARQDGRPRQPDAR